MSDVNLDKAIQQHLKKVFEQYKVDVSDAQKEEIFLEFERFKSHKNQLRISIPELIKNKTFIYILISVVISIILIYFLAYYFPKNHDDKKEHLLKENAHQDILYEDTIMSERTNAALTNTPQNQSTSSETKDTTNIDNRSRSTNLNFEDKKKDTNVSGIVRRTDTSGFSSNTSIMVKTDSLTDDSSTLIKKRKKKKRMGEDKIENTEINTPIEPQLPKLNDKPLNED